MAYAAGQEDLVIAAAGGEGAKGVHDRLEADGGHAAGDADHIGLGNAAVDGALGFGGELGRADAAHQVCVEVDGATRPAPEFRQWFRPGRLYNRRASFSPV